MHECRLCGMECDCDGEDHGGNLQPADCPHLDPSRRDVCEADGDDTDDEELDDSGRPLDWDDA